MGPLVETAAGHALADWKEMLNWSQPPAIDHPLRRRFPHLYPEPLFPQALVPGITEVLVAFHLAIADLQRRFLRVVALAMGCDESFFEEIVSDAPPSPAPSTTRPWPRRLLAATSGLPPMGTST
jgi:isopenicillin N synthase-like dioxygenase